MGIPRHHGDGGMITRVLVGVIAVAAISFGLWAFTGQPDLLAMLGG